MGDLCPICEASVYNCTDVVQCEGKCRKIFHVCCTPLQCTDNLNKYFNTNALWTCDWCFNSSFHVTCNANDVTLTNRFLRELIRQVKREIRDSVRLKKIIQKCIEFITKMMFEFNYTMKKLQETLVIIQNKNNKLLDENETLRLEVASLKAQLSAVTIVDNQRSVKCTSDDISRDLLKLAKLCGIKATINSKPLTKKHLKNLVLSRMAPVSSTSFRTVKDMEKYAETSVSPIYYILLECSKLGDVHTDHAASHLGKAQGITNLLRSIPYNIQNRVVPLPRDLLLKHDLPQEKVLREKCEPQMKEIVYDVASQAKQHLDKARNLRKHCPSSASSVFLPAVCTGSYLKRLQRADFNIFSNQLKRRNNLLHLDLYYHKIFRIY